MSSSHDYDIIVVGGGHAGVEAALAAVRMGATAAVVTMDSARLALMSCNPAIGGIGKSHLVKEVDALGGIMGQAIDATGIQFRRLNLSRGPAVWSTRAQADRIAYNEYIVDFIASQKNLEVIEGTASEILTENGAVVGIRTEEGKWITSGAVVVATGTFLGGLIHIGEKKIVAGRIGEKASTRLSDSFRELGFEVGRLKTGTPPRLDGGTIDWSQCEVQPGEDPVPYFSYRTPYRSFEQTPCHLTQTTKGTKELISANFSRSPIFSGQIKSTGPRYCPSIEDKFFRFADKEAHHIFLEPEGNGTNEVYPNGFSTALPEEIQRDAIRTVRGLEDVLITRPGYAVEYDYCPSHQIKLSLETRNVRGLFLAGQINGTSGYEEAAAQGIMSGINAVQYARGEESLVLDRSEAYIGVMIDDLVTRSTTEPYRMFTSRSEYRLALREDNARDRLFDHAHRLGLIDESDYIMFQELEQNTRSAAVHLEKLRVRSSMVDIPQYKGRKLDTVTAGALLRQPGIGIDDVMPLLRNGDHIYNVESVGRECLERAAIRIRYSGYIDKQAREIGKFRKLESEAVPEEFEFHSLTSLRIEAREKFTRYRPVSIGQAARIEGITPGDVAVLSVHVKRFKAAHT